MDNMKTTLMFVLLLAFLSSFQLITAGESKNASQPHIIFILADDLVSSQRKFYLCSFRQLLTTSYRVHYHAIKNKIKNHAVDKVNK